MPLVTAAHTTPGEDNEFFRDRSKTLAAVAGLVAAVIVVVLLLLWLI